MKIYSLYGAWRKVYKNMTSGFKGVVSTPILFIFLQISAINAAEDELKLDDLIQGFEETSPTNSQDNIDDLLQGFEDTPQIINQTKQTPTAKNWSLVTLSSLSGSYNYQHQAPAADETDYRGLSRLKFKIQPEFRYKFTPKWDSVISASAFYDFAYSINGRSDYTSETLDRYESELELREAYLRGTVQSSLDIKLGRQIVVWGKSDSIRVVDVLNPLDFREPGMVDIEDLRLPVSMLKTDYYFKQWNLSTIIIPEIRFNKMPAYGSDFYVSENQQPTEIKPDHIRDPEFALALEGIFSGWDLSFYLARYYDDQTHMIVNENNKPIRMEHSHLSMLGMASNVALGDWLIKTEAALIDGLEFAKSDNSFRRADLLLGVDYAGFTDQTITLEAVNRHLLNYDNALSQSPDQTKENEGQITFRYSGAFLRDKLQIIATASILGTDLDGGAFYRGSAEYEIANATSITLGGIVYQSGENFLLENIAQNDRVFFDFRYSF